MSWRRQRSSRPEASAASARARRPPPPIGPIHGARRGVELARPAQRPTGRPRRPTRAARPPRPRRRRSPRRGARGEGGSGARRRPGAARPPRGRRRIRAAAALLRSQARRLVLGPAPLREREAVEDLSLRRVEARPRRARAGGRGARRPTRTRDRAGRSAPATTARRDRPRWPRTRPSRRWRRPPAPSSRIRAPVPIGARSVGTMTRHPPASASCSSEAATILPHCAGAPSSTSRIERSARATISRAAARGSSVPATRRACALISRQASAAGRTASRSPPGGLHRAAATAKVPLQRGKIVCRALDVHQPAGSGRAQAADPRCRDLPGAAGGVARRRVMGPAVLHRASVGTRSGASPLP